MNRRNIISADESVRDVLIDGGKHVIAFGLFRSIVITGGANVVLRGLALGSVTIDDPQCRVRIENCAFIDYGFAFRH